jgi:sterol desaturase/sphingolipid hydroxylase (fatty acid hydroxylase superfamily)
MAHYPINHDEKPIRLFQSDFLEFFTHISPITVLVIWVPFMLWMLIGEIRDGVARAASLAYVPAAFLLGLFIWTLAEYLLHRFIFHFKPRSPMQEKITYLFHGIHHHQPQCKTRLVMPPVLSIPLAAVFYGLFTVVLGSWLGLPHWVRPVVAGFTLGYLAYDMTHYATHHFPMRSRVGKFLKRYHMQHHYKTPEQRFGVSSPLWDAVFRTLPPDQAQGKKRVPQRR